MRAYDIIYKKRNGIDLNEEEIEFFIDSFTRGTIPDYQAASFLMAAFMRGMSARETVWLTRTMIRSGETLDLSFVQGVKVDKHSTGGVGDGISLVLAPLAASCGVAVPMVSGRSLGHTGGTLDKLESIPGFRVRLSLEEFKNQIKTCRLAMAGQTDEIAPADRKLYALRDATATVDSIPLIVASILSKKLAEGCDALVLDVKTGAGAFMQDRRSAVQLAKTMVAIGKKFGKRVAALVTHMNQPLGVAVGNSLEMRQAIEILSGKEEKGTQDIIELTETLGGWMLFFSKIVKSVQKGKQMIHNARKDGSGLKKFEEVIKMQGGDPHVCHSPQTVLPRSKCIQPVLSPWKGIVMEMNARSVGVASILLGAGRRKKEDSIDASAGIILHKKVGDRTEKGEALADFHTSDSGNLDQAEKKFLSGVRIGKIKPGKRPLIHRVIT